MEESQTWIEIAKRSGYLNEDVAANLDAKCEEVISQLSLMIRDADSWCAGFEAR
jgi:four helix bundle protein